MYFITRKRLPRRTFLRGLGATLALPLLDSMIPASTALAQTAAKPFKRLNIVFVAHGMVMPHFTPSKVGALELSPILSPLASHKDDVAVLSGLCHQHADFPGAGHAGASAAWLTGVKAKRTEGVDVRNGISIDQLAARQIGQENIIPSLELATEDFTGLVGACDVSFSCVYINTLSWANDTTPLPNEINPRLVFERMIGEGGSVEARAARLQEDRSILDGMLPELHRLSGRIGAGDRNTIDDYVQNVREIERRIRLASQRNEQSADLPAAPIGIPESYEEHIRLMFELQSLAFQSDLTRVSTFVLSRELTNRTYPDLGVPDANHMLSHHQEDPAKLVKLEKVQTWTMGLFSDYLTKLKNTQDASGSLLDSTLLMYGSSMSNSNQHSHYNLPLIVAGGGIKGGQHVAYPDKTPMSNLLLTLVNKAGGHLEVFGDSTGLLANI